MATQLGIINLALTKLGADRIGSGEIATPASKNARESVHMYQHVLDAELRKNSWKFAISRLILLAEPTAPPFGYAYQYVWPTGSIPLRIIQVGDYYPGGEIVDYVAADIAPYAFEKNRILTDDAGPLHVRVVSRPDNPAFPLEYDPLFVQAFACKMAMELAEALTASDNKRERATREYRETMMEAVRMNAIESPPQKVADDTWVLVRA